MWVRAPPSALDSGPESLRTLALWGSGLSAPQRYATHHENVPLGRFSLPRARLPLCQTSRDLTATERSLRWP
jgi:hypothetical protein